MPAYPDHKTARDRFVVAARPDRPARSVWAAPDIVVEDERTAGGDTTRTATVFLTGRECPWRCLMCDLWQYTTEAPTPPGAITMQVKDASQRLRMTHPDVDVVKLYNAGSFFDPNAVPDSDYPAVARAVAGFRQVVVEAHPALVGARTVHLLDMFAAASGEAPVPMLEVAMGLETVHPGALERINKRITFASFRQAADQLQAVGATLRVFLLIAPPFVPPGEQDIWLLRSIDSAVACGASVVSMIPTRGGNGALEHIADDGHFQQPDLSLIERSIALALNRPRPTTVRLFVDLWNLERFATCDHCLPARRARLHAMNLTQSIATPVSCSYCGNGRAA